MFRPGKKNEVGDDRGTYRQSKNANGEKFCLLPAHVSLPVVFPARVNAIAGPKMGISYRQMVRSGLTPKITARNDGSKPRI